MSSKLLSEICEFASGRVALSELVLDSYISTENMLPNKEGIITSTNLPKCKTTKAFQEGDVLVSNIRPYFKKIWYADKAGGCSNDVLVFRAKDEVDSKFLYYILADENFFEYSTATSKGTKMPRGDKTAIMQYEVPDFSIEEQREIAKTLTALDDRIAENKKINHHLEQILQLNFTNNLEIKSAKEKIGSLDLTVSDHVANGSFKSLKDNVELVQTPDYALFLRNVDLKNNLNGERRYVTEATYNFLKKSRLHGHEVIISNVADVGSVHRVPKLNIPMVTGNNVIFLQSENKWLTDYLYVYFKSRYGQHDISSITSGSAQQKFNKTDFRNLEIPILDEDIVIKEITPILKYIDNSKFEITSLMATRDALLVKLMSGEIHL